MSSLPSNELLDPIFEKEGPIESLTVIWFIINNSFLSFEISGGSYNLFRNTLRLISEFEKCILSFIFRAIGKFLFMQGRLGTRLRCTQFRDLNKFPHFLGCLKTHEVPRSFSL